MLEEVNYKWWKNPKPLDEAAIKEELVDVLHFFVSAGQRWDDRSGAYTTDTWIKNRGEFFNRQDGKGKKNRIRAGETPVRGPARA